MDIKDNYDVIVIGGGTAGCAAAWTSGQLGLKTLLIEKKIHLGGSITSGLVVPAMSSSENQINTTFFNNLIKELNTLGAQITYDKNPGWFNPELTKIALDNLMAKVNVDVLFGCSVQNFKISKNEVKSLKISSEMLSEYICAKYFVDATGDCEFFKKLNCEFLNDENNFQPVSMRFIMSGINIDSFSKWILDYDKNRSVTSAHFIDNQIHLSTAYTWDKNKKWALSPIFDDAVANDILKNEDRSYFQVFTIPAMPDSIAFNCPRVYFPNEINPLDVKNFSEALKKGRQSILRLSEFCKLYFPGFKDAYISNIADDLGIRVSRRIKGKYIYTIDDLKSGKSFDNAVLRANYPIDVHSNKKSRSMLEHVNSDYELPIESLMSEKFENLFVAGRGVSADFYAQAALRIQPSCFSMGEGVAKFIHKKLS